MTTEAAAVADTRAVAKLGRIAAAVDPYPEGDDAAVLGAAITRATEGDLMLVTIEPDLPLVIPGVNWRQMRRETETMLGRTRESFAPEARLTIDTDLSIPRGLRRVIAAEHRQLVACGSSRHGEPGVVSLGKTTRQLVGHAPCALAIAPRGLSERGELTIRRIGVGFDGSAEGRAAISAAAGVAASSGAELVIRGIVDDRIPALAWSGLWTSAIQESWDGAMDDEAKDLTEALARATSQLPTPVDAQVHRGRAATSLRELSDDVDLLAIGSRHWGPVAHVLLGGIGESLVRGARCSLLIVPRPPHES
jgi:nucleotide-binding universal stress UspA family protein